LAIMAAKLSTALLERQLSTAWGPRPSRPGKTTIPALTLAQAEEIPWNSWSLDGHDRARAREARAEW
jgi:hypothetical protein